MHTNDIFELEDGFYHRTEDDDMIGPFANAKLAQTALDAYLRWAQHDHQDQIRKMRDIYD